MSNPSPPAAVSGNNAGNDDSGMAPKCPLQVLQERSPIAPPYFPIHIVLSSFGDRQLRRRQFVNTKLLH